MVERREQEPGPKQKTVLSELAKRGIEKRDKAKNKRRGGFPDPELEKEVVDIIRMLEGTRAMFYFLGVEDLPLDTSREACLQRKLDKEIKGRETDRAKAAEQKGALQAETRKAVTIGKEALKREARVQEALATVSEALTTTEESVAELTIRNHDLEAALEEERRKRVALEEEKEVEAAVLNARELTLADVSAALISEITERRKDMMIAAAREKVLYGEPIEVVNLAELEEELARSVSPRTKIVVDNILSTFIEARDISPQQAEEMLGIDLLEGQMGLETVLQIMQRIILWQENELKLGQRITLSAKTEEQAGADNDEDTSRKQWKGLEERRERRKRIGEALKKLRLNRGMDRKVLGEKVGLTNSNLFALEATHKRDVSEEELEQIVAALGEDPRLVSAVNALAEIIEDKASEMRISSDQLAPHLSAIHKHTGFTAADLGERAGCSGTTINSMIKNTVAGSLSAGGIASILADVNQQREASNTLYTALKDELETMKAKEPEMTIGSAIRTSRLQINAQGGSVYLEQLIPGMKQMVASRVETDQRNVTADELEKIYDRLASEGAAVDSREMNFLRVALQDLRFTEEKKITSVDGTVFSVKRLAEITNLSPASVSSILKGRRVNLNTLTHFFKNIRELNLDPEIVAALEQQLTSRRLEAQQRRLAK